MLPDDNTLPDSLYTIKKFLMEFNLGYEKIDACVNDCCLFRKEYEHLEKCPKCKTSRWMPNNRTKKPKKGVSAKVLRYFPIIPRLKRMFMSSEKSKQLRWHYSHGSQDGKYRNTFADTPFFGFLVRVLNIQRDVLHFGQFSKCS